jgi:hypothetical protein
MRFFSCVPIPICYKTYPPTLTSIVKVKYNVNIIFTIKAGVNNGERGTDKGNY